MCSAAGRFVPGTPCWLREPLVPQPTQLTICQCGTAALPSTTLLIECPQIRLRLSRCLSIGQSVSIPLSEDLGREHEADKRAFPRIPWLGPRIQHAFNTHYPRFAGAFHKPTVRGHNAPAQATGPLQTLHLSRPCGEPSRCLPPRSHRCLHIRQWVESRYEPWVPAHALTPGAEHDFPRTDLDA